MREIINYVVRKLTGVLGTNHLVRMATDLSRLKEVSEAVLICSYLKENLFENPKYKNTKRLGRFYRSVFAQNGEDGVIEEIFNRIGVTNKTFVEFGAHGIKNNSTFLLVKGWNGLWIGAKHKKSERLIRNKFRELIRSGQLRYLQEWIDEQNIEDLFRQAAVPENFDLLSIDLDGNDYWIWKAISSYRPRVVSIEYNATLPHHVFWVMKYNAGHKWDQTSFFGASLAAMEKLAGEKGYKLVGCDFSGCNAFFVSQDENLEQFEAPFTAGNHYEPPRYFLRRASGHSPGFGPFLSEP